MSAPFTPEQEARLREIIREEVEYGVMAGVGDMDRILLSLAHVRREMSLPAPTDMTEHQHKIYVSNLATDQANADRGWNTNFSERCLHSSRFGA